MEEKQHTFEMDDSRSKRMKQILWKYRTIYPTDQITSYSNDKRNELLKYIEEHKSDSFIASFKPTDLIDLPNIATRIMEYFEYWTVVLETPYGNHSSKNRTVLVKSRWSNEFLITLQDADQEYMKWKNWNPPADNSQVKYNILNVFPSRTQFMAIYCYHIENMLKNPNGRNQQSFSCVTGYIFRQLAALYLYKKYKNKLEIDLVPKSAPEWSNIWRPLLNFFQVGSLSNVTKFATNELLVGRLRLTEPGYASYDITDTTINNLASPNDIDKNNAKLLIDLLSGQKVDHLKKILWLIGKVMLGDYFVRQLCSKESHLTIIQYHKPNLIEICLYVIFNQLRNVLLQNTNHDIKDRIANSSLYGIEKFIPNHLFIIANELFEINHKDIIDNYISYQINGVQVYIITEPDRTIRNIDFFKDLFNGKTVTYEDAYKKHIALRIKEEDENGKKTSKYQQFYYAIPGGLNYTCNTQTIFITDGESDMASKLSDAKKTDINYIDIDWDLAPLEDFIKKNSITPIVAGKLAMMSMVYMMNKLCLGIDAFDTVDHPASPSYHDEKTEREYINEFYADCIEDLTENLDPAKIIKDTESILKENNESYEKVDWREASSTATAVHEQELLRDLPTVTDSCLLTTYQTWRATKNIASPDLTLKKICEELLNRLAVLKNQELVNYKKIFLCRKPQKQYRQTLQCTAKLPRGMLGIQITDNWHEITKNKMKQQAAQEKENYEKVFSLLEAQFDDAMKEIQSFKLPPQSYIP